MIERNSNEDTGMNWRQDLDKAPTLTRTLLLLESGYNQVKYPALAVYYPRFTLQLHEDIDTEYGDYSEEDDEYYAFEGWYECSQADEVKWNITDKILAWLKIDLNLDFDS